MWSVRCSTKRIIKARNFNFLRLLSVLGDSAVNFLLRPDLPQSRRERRGGAETDYQTRHDLKIATILVATNVNSAELFAGVRERLVHQLLWFGRQWFIQRGCDEIVKSHVRVLMTKLVKTRQCHQPLCLILCILWVGSGSSNRASVGIDHAIDSHVQLFKRGLAFGRFGFVGISSLICR